MQAKCSNVEASASNLLLTKNQFLFILDLMNKKALIRKKQRQKDHINKKIVGSGKLDSLLLAIQKATKIKILIFYTWICIRINLTGLIWQVCCNCQ